MARTGFSNTVYYTFTSAADMAFVQNTWVFTIVATFALTDYTSDAYQLFVDSANATSTNKGFFFYYENRTIVGSPANIRLRPCHGGASAGVLASAVGSIADNNYHTVAFSCNGDGSSLIVALDGVANTPSLTTFVSTSTGNATFTPRIGSSASTGAGALAGKLARLEVAPYYATADELRAITLGYPLPRRMWASTATAQRFNRTVRDDLGTFALTATGSPSFVDSPRIRLQPPQALHQPQRGLARRMALEGLYVGGGR